MRGECFLKGDGCSKAGAEISLNRISTVRFDSNWVNDGDNQMITPMLLVTTGSELFHYNLLFALLHAMNEGKHIAKAALVDGAISYT